MTAGNNDTWYGLAANGEQRMISHAALMDWAYRNDSQFTVGWSHAVQLNDGTRLVRGPRMIESAREKGWTDIADALVSFGFKDELEARKVTS